MDNIYNTYDDPFFLGHKFLLNYVVRLFGQKYDRHPLRMFSPYRLVTYIQLDLAYLSLSTS